MSVVLQISDLHFGTEVAPVVEALFAFSRSLKPDVLVLSGDITQRAARAQFEAARVFVERLDVARRLVIAGNHDLPLLNPWARLCNPYAGFRRAFGSELEPVLETEDLLIIGVKTTRRRRHKDGEVDAAQAQRVAMRLQAAKASQLRIVVTHQPLHVSREQDEHNVLHGHRAAALSWSEAGADLLLAGHIHLPYVRPLRDRIPSLVYDTWVANAGTATSSRVRWEAPNSVNVIRHDDDAAHPRNCAIERWDYAADTQSFALHGRTDIVR